jgi:hypothetical protein
MATIPEIEARIHALWAKGDARTPDESVELGQWLTSLDTEMPPGDFYRHVLEVLHIPARDAQRFMAEYRASQGVDKTPAPEGLATLRPHAEEALATDGVAARISGTRFWCNPAQKLHQFLSTGLSRSGMAFSSKFS